MIILLKPIEKKLIWGTEQWGVSANLKGNNEILNSEYKGETLNSLWESHRELFVSGCKKLKDCRFPLLTKIIDAKDDLSIQVHPNNEYAMKHENGSFGKTECWYIIDAEPNSKLVIGHNAKSKEELERMIENKEWNLFIREVPIHKGDFFFIDAGTVHAIKGGVKILETQQSSDITYRIYDYDRLQNGKPRELHVNKSIDVITVPFVEKNPPLNLRKRISDKNNEFVQQLVSCPYFTVWYAEIKEYLFLQKQKTFMTVSVINGSCSVEEYSFSYGDHFIIPCGSDKICLKGNAKLVISTL